LADTKKKKKKKSSAEKRHRQSEERRMRNKAVKSSVRTSVKKFIVLTQKNDEKSEEAFREMVKKIDTASRKGIIKKNAAARKKSRMQLFFNAIKARNIAAQ
jgi:small subunit ribosomal protein S20